MKFKKTNIAYLLKKIFPWGIQYNTLLKYTRQVINKLILINEAIHKIAVVLLLFFLMHTITMAQESDGAICISETKKEPQENSMLEVESDTKGILIPHMSFETMLNIDPKHDGLTVYVTDEDKKGFYFYKEDDEGEGKWVKLMNSTMGRQDITSPPGTIIMYVGPVQGLFEGDGKGINKMEGWQICNGENDSPDLTGRFMVGAKFENQNTFNSNLEEAGGENTISIDISQLHPHSHTFKIQQVEIEKHTHEIPYRKHAHSFSVIKICRGPCTKSKKSGIKLYQKNSVGTYWFNAFEVLFYLNNTTKKIDYIVNDESFNNLSLNSTPEETIDNLNFDQDATEPEGRNEEYDNRPSYSVVLYLIKL